MVAYIGRRYDIHKSVVLIDVISHHPIIRCSAKHNIFFTMATTTPTSYNHPRSPPSLVVANRPKDGPATSFEADELAKLLVENKDKDTTYGLVLVAAWPPSFAWREIYASRIRPRLAACFPSDIMEDSSASSSSSVYIYPPEALHVTLATFWSIHCKETISQGQAVDLERSVKAVVERAWQQYQNKFPNERHFVLEVESAQIGTKAGIILWKESSGRLHAFRRVLHQTCQEECQRLEEPWSLQGEPVDANSMFVRQALSQIKVPDIVHSTVVRFAETPVTKGVVVQSNFERFILDKLATELVPQSLHVPTIKLVCERQPYMHVPPDDRHVLWANTLGQDDPTT